MKTRVLGLAAIVAMAACTRFTLHAVDSRLEHVTTLDDYHPWAPYYDVAAWKERAKRLREQILVAAGLWPMPPAAPLDAVIHGKVDRDEYTVEKVFFQSYPGFYVTGSLYRPRAGAGTKHAAVLCPHGHWANGRFYERPEQEAEREIAGGGEKTMAAARYLLQARCAMLARLGCIVFHYDMVGNADSKQLPHGQGFADVDGELRLQSAFGLQTYNSIRALDFVSSLPDVDPGRIGVTGASGGGTQTFILCAIDDRPAAAFPAVMVSTGMQGGCVCENASLLRVGTGNIELAALMAPRPLAMSGANDWTIDIEKKGLPELKVLYTALGVPDLVDAKCFPQFDHNYNSVSCERMYAWFNRHLKLGHAEPIEERPFEPIAPKDLSVFDAEHPRPTGALDGPALRKSMAEASDRQMAALVPRDAASLAEYQRVVRAALRAIVSDELPDRSAVSARVAVRADDVVKGKPCRAERVILSREGAHEEVPVLVLVPAGWTGDVDVLVGGGGEASVRGLAEAVVERGAAAVAPDVFLTGELTPRGGEIALLEQRSKKGYAGYTFGYNRSVMANRVHDVLTVLAYARAFPSAKSVRLVGTGEAGLWALLARGLCGDAVSSVVADRPAFDFADVTSLDDPRLLPGGVKYGGWGGLAALCAPGALVLRGDGEPPAVLRAAYAAAGAAGSLRIAPAGGDLVQLLGSGAP